jgi:hypothetical protein
MRAGAASMRMHAGSAFSPHLRSTNWRRTSLLMMLRRARVEATTKPGDV